MNNESQLVLPSTPGAANAIRHTGERSENRQGCLQRDSDQGIDKVILENIHHCGSQDCFQTVKQKERIKLDTVPKI